MRRYVVLMCVVAVLIGGCADSGVFETPQSSATPAPDLDANQSSVTTLQTAATSTSTPVSTTRASPSTVSTTVTTSTLPPVGRLEQGLLCRDLNARGYTYGEAVAYWDQKGSPDRMDADRNGIPCQTVYPHADVVQYWGEPLPIITRNQFAFIVSVESGPPVSIVADYADWLWCEEAEKACREDEQGPDCPYEGLYYIRNVNPRLRTLTVADDAMVFLAFSSIECEPVTAGEMRDAGFDDHPTDGCAIPASALPLAWPYVDGSDGGSWSLVWLIVDGNIVTAIQEQYIP